MVTLKFRIDFALEQMGTYLQIIELQSIATCELNYEREQQKIILFCHCQQYVCQNKRQIYHSV